MIIYFLSALLIAAAVYKLGTYAMLVGMIITATKAFMALVALAITVLLWRRYRENNRSMRVNAAS